MRVVDTSAWIEWLLGTALGKSASTSNGIEKPLHRTPSVIARSPCDEATQGPRDAAPGLLRFARNDGFSGYFQTEPTAMKHGAGLLTCDSHFASLPGVVYFAKSPSP
jgi:hypothetical protein